MRIAILGESPADEIAVRILVDSILELTSEGVSPVRIRSRGWPAVLNALPGVIRQLHYVDAADGLIVVADSDDSPLHEGGHNTSFDENCRLCQIQEKATFTLNSLTAPKLRVAVGIAVPAIEAWYLFADDASLTESTWKTRLGSGRRSDIRRELKRRVYGTLFPTQTAESQKAEQATKRLLSQMELFEQHFPNGFGPLAKSVRSWKATEEETSWFPR